MNQDVHAFVQGSGDAMRRGAKIQEERLVDKQTSSWEVDSLPKSQHDSLVR